MDYRNMEFKTLKKKLEAPPDIWEKAINGDSAAQLELGKHYFISDYTSDNCLKSFEWISRSAKQGNLEAQFRLGDLYALGWGTSQCPANAYDWYTKAAIQGYKKALIRIHNLYQEDLRIRCRGQLTFGEGEWTESDFKEENNIRELSEFRLSKFKYILHGIIDYYTNQAKESKAANKEEPDVQLNLGFLFQHGYGVKQYDSVAIAYYTKAAEQGLVSAQYNLGFLYQQNKNMKFNYRKAFYWYTLAANGENVAAQYCLAYFYEKGLATDIDYQKALQWYTKAANTGNSGAQLTLGTWYRKGQCIDKDLTQAVKWYTLAARQGNYVAQNCLDVLYQNGVIMDTTNHQQVPEYSTEESRNSRLCSKLRKDVENINDYSKVKRFQKMASHAFRGDGNAMYEIGLDYYNGDNFIQDKDTSFKWIRNAANAGCKQAQLKMAEMYKQGDAVDQDYYKTSIWIKKLAKSKDNVGQYNLGILYKEGLGVRCDILEASKWLILSSDQENSGAMYELGLLYFNCDYVTTIGRPFKNDHSAFYWVYKSAMAGNLSAYREVGVCYLYGIGVEKEKNKGLSMLEYSARNENDEARFILGRLYEKGEEVNQTLSKATEYYSMISNGFASEYTIDLAIKYLKGELVIQDNRKAYDLFKQAVKKHNSLTQYIFRLPLRYRNDINYCELVDMFIEVSKFGIDDMEYNIGYMYEYGMYSDTMEELFEINYNNAIEWYSISATKGDSRAQYRLGIMYEEGKGIESDLILATDYYHRAADKNNADAKFRLACMYLKGYLLPQDVIKAFYLFRDLADQCHTKSRKFLMFSYNPEEFYFGDHPFIKDPQILITKQDQFQLLETMAEQGLVHVQYQLGSFFHWIGHPKAFKWLTLAAQWGISDACYRLGILYENGIHTEQNYTKAIELYKNAIEGGYEDAMYRLAILYQYGKGTHINYIKAYDLYFRSSEMGHRLSFKRLNITGDLYKNSIGIMEENRFDLASEEFKESLSMCEYVAEQGNVDLQYRIGTVYEDHLTKPDYSKAFKWYKMASFNFHTEAIYRLGLLYEKGFGVGQDYNVAIQLYEKAKYLDSNEAIFRLAMIYHYGNGIDTSPSKAIEYYKRAANLGNPSSQHKLGDLYLHGELVEQNITEALKWYTRAYLQGHDTTISNLIQFYDDSPYESFFYKKLHQIFGSNISLSLGVENYTDREAENWIEYCTRLGYWYLQHGNFEKMWEYFSIPYENMWFDRVKFRFLESKYVTHEDKAEILNTLEINKELVRRLNSGILYDVGMSYYNGVFEESEKNEPQESKVEYMLVENKNKKQAKGILIKQDYNKALFFLEEAAEKGNDKAQYQLGIMYQNGHGVDKDIEKAQTWYSTAVTNNIGNAPNVGIQYHCDGPFQNFSKALELYKKSKDDQANIQTGILYQYGCGVEKDFKKAVEYYEKGVHYYFHYFYLGVAYFKAESDIQDYNRSFRLFQKMIKFEPYIADKKMIFTYCRNDIKDSETSEKCLFILEPEGVFYGEAYYYLGIMHKNGQGTTQDEVKAKEYFLKAVGYGNEKAKYYIQ